MAKPYSIDLREHVVAAVESHGMCCERPPPEPSKPVT